MENVFIIKEIKFLNATYCIHIFTFIFIWVIYLAMHENIYWIFDYSILLFEISLYVFLSFTFLLMILFFVFTCAKMVEKKIKIIIKITVVFFILSIINSLFCSVISCYNSTLFKSFYLNCPFNYNIEDIPMMIDKANISERMRKNFCDSRKCFKINNISNIYLCNFQEKDKYKQYPIEDYLIEYAQLYNFTKFCSKYSIFYLYSKDKYKEYDIEYDFLCPSKSNISYCYVMTYLFIFCDLCCGSILWLFEYFSLKTLLDLIINSRNYNFSLRDTNNTSKIDGNNNLPNNNGEEKFEKKKTEIIIIDNSYIEQNQNIEENKVINNENNKDASKSENQLINNMNNNIFKIMNQNTNIKNDDKK